MPSANTKSSKRAPHSRGEAMPVLFARATHLLGWQGLTLTIPEDWNLTAYGGDWDKGHLRADDEDGPRLEIRWETPRKSVDLPRSVEGFLDTLAKQAKKEKRGFEAIRDARVISPKRKRKAQLASFGWKGDPNAPGRGRSDLAAQGFGVAWECDTCGRVVLAHVLGRSTERPGQTLSLASEVLHSMDCHGAGGWVTWSIFGLQLEVPEEFRLHRAKLLTGRLDLEWAKPPVPGLLAPFRRPERIVVTRLSAANVLLEAETLADWTTRVMSRPDKLRQFDSPEETEARGHPAMTMTGRARDFRKQLRYAIWDRLRREKTPPARITTWQCPESNKLYALDCEVSRANAHVASDMLDSLACH